jgi:hypothetical protein
VERFPWFGATAGSASGLGVRVDAVWLPLRAVLTQLFFVAALAVAGDYCRGLLMLIAEDWKRAMRVRGRGVDGSCAGHSVVFARESSAVRQQNGDTPSEVPFLAALDAQSSRSNAQAEKTGSGGLAGNMPPGAEARVQRTGCPLARLHVLTFAGDERTPTVAKESWQSYTVESTVKFELDEDYFDFQ